MYISSETTLLLSWDMLRVNVVSTLLVLPIDMNVGAWLSGNRRLTN